MQRQLSSLSHDPSVIGHTHGISGNPYSTSLHGKLGKHRYGHDYAHKSTTAQQQRLQNSSNANTNGNGNGNSQQQQRPGHSTHQSSNRMSVFESHSLTFIYCCTKKF